VLSFAWLIFQQLFCALPAALFFISKGKYMTSRKTIAAILAVSALAFVVSACQKKEEAAGPAESAGKQIDSAVQNAGAQADSTADKAKEKLDEAGKKIDQAVDSAKDGAKDLTQKAGEKIESAGQAIQDAAKK